MSELISNIVSYLDYLRNECDLNVSVHFGDDIFNRIPNDIASKLLPYNSHKNTYCVMTKCLKLDECILNQREILKKCENKKSFTNICHAGVSEYIFPIENDGIPVGFASVSGYREKDETQKNIINRELWLNSLNTQIPKSLADSIIPPLCIMLEKMFSLYLLESSNEYNLILKYLNEYHINISLLDLTKHFNRSASHISRLFNRESGMTIRAYCNDLKLEDAKKLLLSTDFSVSQISFDVGFNDTSYFIYLFKKKNGISPLQFRQKNQIK